MKSRGIAETVSYACPGCGAGLEAPADGARAWQRCPRCGRASLAPETWPAPKEAPVSGTFVTAPARSPRRRRPVGIYGRNAGRVALGSWLYGSSLALVFALLEQNGAAAALFAFMVIISLLVLLRPPRASSPRPGRAGESEADGGTPPVPLSSS